MTDAVPVEAATHALRRVRPSVYRIGHGAGRTTIVLSVRASPAGRRNAAERVVAALAAGGIGLAAADPVAELAGGADLALVYRPVRAAGPVGPARAGGDRHPFML
jgi:hypothetical protein